MITILQGKPVMWQGKIATINTSASGGTVTYDGDYAIHTFLTSGKFSVITPGIFEVFLVGGGGGGKFNGLTGVPYGGGGGGEVKLENIKVYSGIYDVSVGLGGNVDNDGQNSYFYTLLSQGGHTPSSNLYNLDGGISGTNKAGGAGAYDRSGGGGGGSTSVGGDGDLLYNAGEGGNGYNGFGGGGGGCSRQSNYGLGVDGGGNGGKYSSGILHAKDGSTNTGGGGGGGMPGTFPVNAGKGGSGIAIIRYKYK